ncbi:MAG: hypothetical protein M1831_003092 [Alyxoria varia]|nr:MAG: hypothetical protein M1831_003092 [Alyxoria varia]
MPVTLHQEINIFLLAAAVNIDVIALQPTIAAGLLPHRPGERARVTVGDLALPLAAVEVMMPETRIPPVLQDAFHREETTGTPIRATMMDQEPQGPDHLCVNAWNLLRETTQDQGVPPAVATLLDVRGRATKLVPALLPVVMILTLQTVGVVGPSLPKGQHVLDLAEIPGMSLRNPRSPYANNGYEKEAEPPYRPAAKEPVAPASEYRERAPPTGPANNGRYAGPPSETASPSSSTMPMSAHNRPGSASMNPPSHPRGSGGFRGRGGPSPYSRDQAPARDYPGPPFRRGSSFDGPRGGLSSRGAHGPPRGGDPYPPRDPYSPIDSNRFDGPSRGPPPSRPPPRRGGDSYGAGSGPPSFRGSSNSTSMTYPRTQRFNQATPASRALADLPTPKDGGEKLPPLWESSKAEKLEEDAAKLRKMIDDREMKKRETIREWDKLERETSTASLRSDLAEQQLRALNGDHEGMSEAF